MNEQFSFSGTQYKQATDAWQQAMQLKPSNPGTQIIKPVLKDKIRKRLPKVGSNVEQLSYNKEPEGAANHSCVFPPEQKVFIAPNGTSQQTGNLFRLFVKNGEYVYARPNDIVMIESCNHMVKVYLGFNDKVKKTIRHNTLKDFLLQLPQDQFMRIGRFCAVNINRLSAGNCNEQTFEFDFQLSIKLNHPIPHTAFYSIGK